MQAKDKFNFDRFLLPTPNLTDFSKIFMHNDRLGKYKINDLVKFQRSDELLFSIIHYHKSI